MSHQRGQIQIDKAITGEYFWKVYTGCEWLDDFYTCDTYTTALEIQHELTQINR